MHINSLYKYFGILSCAVIVLFVSCAEEVQQHNGEMKLPLKLDAINQAAITRTSTDIQGSLFLAGQQIGAYTTITGATDVPQTTTYGNPLVLKAKAAVNGVNPLVADDGSTLYFPPGENVNVSIDAVYPSTVSKSITTFSVVNPQTSDEAYMASDLMFASVNTPKTDQTVHLQFAHQMSKLVVNASGVDDVTIKSITLKNIYQSVDFDPSVSPWQLTSTIANKADLKIVEGTAFVSSVTGVALFPPQTHSDTNFMEVVVKNSSGSEGTAYFLLAEKQFEAGKVYTINLKVGPKNLLEGESGMVTIAPWPASVGTINVEAVGNLGLAITNLADDGQSTTNTMTVNGNDKYYTYNGKDCTPVPTVTDGKETNPTTLTKGVDYSVAYYNNQNAGTAIIVVSGMGEYEGLSTFTTFNIKKAANTMSYPSATMNVSLSRNAIVPNALNLPNYKSSGEEVYGRMTFKIYSDAGMTTEVTSATAIASVDASGNVSMLKKGGPVYIKATMDDSGNFEAATASYSLTITAGDAASAMTVEWTYGDENNQYSTEYTGSALEPAFVVKDNGNTLVPGTDYTYVFSNNTNVGTTAKLTITGKGEYSGTKDVYFTITKATTVITVNIPSKIISSTKGTNYNGDNIDYTTCSGAFSTNFGTLTLTSGNTSYATISGTDIVGKAVSSGYVTITANVAESANWKAATATMQVKVEQMYWKIAYSGAMTSITLPNTKNATVYAELIGGAGGNDGTDAQPGVGGFGGYVKAHRNYSSGTAVTLYVCVGGGGIHATGTGAGWNGGGLPGLTGASGGGGGATDISTSGTAYDNATHIANRVLVAGGGGGSSNIGGGGSSAAPIGTDDTGDRTDGNWRGEDNTVGSVDGGGGGAGYVGGIKGIEAGSTIKGGHGGSNFVHTSWTADSNGTSNNGGWHGTGTNIGYQGSGQHGYAYIWYTYEDN